MDNYAYLMASLPMVFLDSEEVPTINEFLDSAKSSLTQKDMELLMQFGVSPSQELLQSCNIDVLKMWLEFDIGLKNEIARARAQKLGFEAEKYILRDEKTGADFSGNPNVSDIARNAIANSSPLSAEIFLLEERWKLLDDIEIGRFFDIVRVIVFYLKLQIVLKRKNLQNLEKGRQNYQEIYSQTAEEFNK